MINFTGKKQKEAKGKKEDIEEKEDKEEAESEEEQVNAVESDLLLTCINDVVWTGLKRHPAMSCYNSFRTVKHVLIIQL